MITLYNRINSLCSLKKRSNLPQITKSSNGFSFIDSTYNREIEARLKRDFDELKKAVIKDTVNQVISDEFGKEIPCLTGKVSKKFMSGQNTFGVA